MHKPRWGGGACGVRGGGGWTETWDYRVAQFQSGRVAKLLQRVMSRRLSMPRVSTWPSAMAVVTLPKWRASRLPQVDGARRGLKVLLAFQAPPSAEVLVRVEGKLRGGVTSQ